MEDETTGPEQAIPVDNESPHPHCSQGKAKSWQAWALEHGPERYRLLAENAQDVVWVLDRELRYVYVNPSIKNLGGYKPEEILESAIADVLTPDSYQKTMEIFHREKALELSGQRHGRDWSIQLELEMLRKDGAVIWTEVNVGIIYDESDRPIGLLGITRDIDDRKRIEAALKESEERYRLLADNARDVIWMRDLDFRGLYLSPSVKHLRGYTAEEAMQQGFQDLLTPASFQDAMQVFERERHHMLETGLPAAPWSVTLELEVVCKGGSTKVTENTINLLYSQAGEVIGLMGITRDIDQRKKAEEALRESEQKYRLLVDNANEGIFVAQNGILLYVNPKTTEILGYTFEELTSRPFCDFIHADDRGMVTDRHHRRMRGEAVPEAYHFRIINRTGATLWIELRGVRIEWQGRPATLNLMTDITARKQAENNLRERQARLDSIFRVAPVGIGVVVGRVLVEVNDRLCEMTGYARSELIGRSLSPQNDHGHEPPGKLLPQLSAASGGEFVPQAIETLAIDTCNQIKRQGWGHLETRWQSKDGGIMDVLVNSTPIDPDDYSSGIIFTALDITERKRAGEELQRHHDRLEELVKERTHELLQANIRLHREIAVGIRSEERLRAGEIELKDRQKALEEMNTALKVLLRQGQEDKENLEHNLVANINTSLLVYLDKLKSSGLRKDQLQIMSEIKRQLKKISTSFIRDLTSEHLGLSPSEIRVASLIKDGKSSKEIAGLLNVSLNTILFHRNNLRNKLGLKESKVNLMSYLQHYDQERC